MLRDAAGPGSPLHPFRSLLLDDADGAGMTVPQLYRRGLRPAIRSLRATQTLKARYAIEVPPFAEVFESTYVPLLWRLAREHMAASAGSSVGSRVAS